MVRLSLSNAGDVRDAYDLMMLRIARRAVDAKIEGVYVERMGKAGREVILGMHRDRQFGPMLMFGLGGFTADVLHENKHMQSVFRHSGLKVSSQLRQGVYHFDLDFE